MKETSFKTNNIKNTNYRGITLECNLTHVLMHGSEDAELLRGVCTVALPRPPLMGTPIVNTKTATTLERTLHHTFHS